VSPADGAAAPDGLVVLVTGATGPAGRAVARRFAVDGARVALNGSDRGRLEAVIADLADGAASGTSSGVSGGMQDRLLAAPGDLTDAETARGVVAAVVEAFGRVDVVAHLVGGWVGGTEVQALDHAEVRRMLDQHLWTTLNVLQAVVPGMRERGFGRVVAVSSPFAANPAGKGASYAMAKSAEEVLLRSVAKEAAGDGVTANILVVRTLDDARSRGSQPGAKTAGWTTPDEVADAIAFLASPGGAAVTGARIPLDGRG
jgi:NAD(P)-dependent dehydrogenase (short-subunit alcohol dehydrogenase family)